MFKVYKFEIEGHPMAHRFKAEHRIRLEIVNGDSPLTDAIFTNQYMPCKVGHGTIHHSAEYPSRLIFPIV